MYQMSAVETAAALPSAERVVTLMISRSAALFRLPDNVLCDMDHHWTAGSITQPSRRVERRCAMKRARAKVTYKPPPTVDLHENY